MRVGRRVPSRREVLRGLGLGLGWLPLVRAARAADALPKRLVCVVQPFGYRAPYWAPSITGPLARAPLPDSSSPLQTHQDALIFLPGLTNPGVTKCTSCDDRAYGSILSGRSVNASATFAESVLPSVDQIVATTLAKTNRRPLPSLALGVMVDVGRAVPLGGRRCSWRDRGQPIAPEESPHALFAALFGGSADAQTTRRMMDERRSVLDYVSDDLKQYQQRLGTEDRLTVDQHLRSVRALEQGLGVLPVACTAPALGPALDSHRRRNFAKVADLQLQLLVAALRCDVTRVVTLQLGNAVGSDVSMDFIPGVAGREGNDWGTIARAAPASAGDRKRLVDKWTMGLVARLLTLMKADPMGPTLLDQSAVLWATTMSDGAERDNQKVPWLLAGKCGGYFATGQTAGSAGKPLQGVLAELCAAMDAPVEFIADRSFGTPIGGLKA